MGISNLRFSYNYYKLKSKSTPSFFFNFSIFREDERDPYRKLEIEHDHGQKEQESERPMLSDSAIFKKEKTNLAQDLGRLNLDDLGR